MQRLGFTESAHNSDTLLDEVIATKKNVLNVSSFRGTLAKGSKGGPISPFRTVYKSQVGNLCITIGFRSATPFRNRLMWGWDEILRPNPAPRVV